MGARARKIVFVCYFHTHTQTHTHMCVCACVFPPCPSCPSPPSFPPSGCVCVCVCVCPLQDKLSCSHLELAGSGAAQTSQDFYPCFDTNCSVIITPDFNTKFILPHLEVIVKQGEVLFFTSDTIHAGAAHWSPGQNRRLHTYHSFHDQDVDTATTVDSPLACRPFMEDHTSADFSFFTSKEAPTGATGLI